MMKLSPTPLFFFTVLFLSYLLSHAARPHPHPHPSFLNHSSSKTQYLGVETEHALTVDESCEDVGDEECLMRRTLAAHLDYIYTQKHKP